MLSLCQFLPTSALLACLEFLDTVYYFLSLSNISAAFKNVESQNIYNAILTWQMFYFK